MTTTEIVVEPLLSYEEAGPFIFEAELLVRHYRLYRRNEIPPDFPLGAKLGVLSTDQLVCLIASALGFLTNPKPRSVPSQDYWLNETILTLYYRFSERLLADFRNQPHEHLFVMAACLDRIIGRALGRPHTLPYDSIGRSVWEHAIDVGAMVLRIDFPSVPRNRHFGLALSRMDQESQAGWILDLAEALRASPPADLLF